MPHGPGSGANMVSMQYRSHSIHRKEAPKGLARLWQPRRAVFWLMVAVNLLSTFWGWLLRSDMLNGLGMWVVGVLALGNTVVGMWLAWRLVRGD